MYTNVPYFIAPHFTVILRYLVFLINWRFVEIPHNWACLLAHFFPIAFASCLCVTFWSFSQYFKLSIIEKVATRWRSRWWLAFFSNKVFCNYDVQIVYLDTMLYCTLNRLQYRVNITFICTEKPKQSYDFLFVIFALLQWSEPAIYIYIHIHIYLYRKTLSLYILTYTPL